MKIDVKSKEITPQNLALVVTSPFSMHMIKAIDARSQIIVFSFALTLHFLHWPTKSYWQVELDEDEDELVRTHTLVDSSLPST